MNTLKRMFQMRLTAREMVVGKRIMAIVMLPILVFYMTSLNFLAMEVMKAQAADGSGTMTVDDDQVTAGGAAQNFKFTFDPNEDMDLGSVRIEFPAPFPAPSLSGGNGGITVVEKNSADLDMDHISVGGAGDRFLTIPITAMSASQYFTVTYNVTSTMPTVIGTYEFTTESQLAGGSFRDLSSSRQASIEIKPGAVDHYTVSTPSGVRVGNNFDVTVTAKDADGNTTVGSSSVDLAVQVETGGTISGVLDGDVTADTTGDGSDTVSLKYTKAQNSSNEIRIHAEKSGISGNSSYFQVADLTAPTFSSPGSSTNDSTPTITWSAVTGTSIAYDLTLITLADSGSVCDETTIFASPLLHKSNADLSGGHSYTLSSGEALLDESYYCIKINATDSYANTVDAYKRFHLLTSKPATPGAVYIPEVGDANSNGHPENTINIYNNDSVSVKVYHSTTLDGGKVYVKIIDGLGHETSEYNADIIGATDNTTVSGIDASSLQQGVLLDIKARVEDAGTNSSDLAYTTTSGGADSWITKDTSPPTRPSAVSFVDGFININNQDAVSISVTGESLTTAYYSVTSSGGGGTVSDHFTMTGATTVSPDKDMTSLANGTLTASVYLVDSAWNHSNARTGTVSKDATAPNVALTYNLNRPVRDADTLRVTATFSEAVKDAPIPQIAVDFAGGAGSDIAATNMTKTDATHYYYDVNVPVGSDGTATITISNAEDLAGNANNSATNNTFTVDNINPAITFTNDVEAGPVQSDTIRITVVETNADAATYKYIFADDNVCNTKDYSGGTAFTSGVDFVINDQTHNGKYICAKAVDQAGNINYQTSANALNIDITGPTLTFTDNVLAGPVQSDTVAADWGDATLASKKWKYNTDTTCPTTIGSYDKTSADSMDQSVETNNGKYICLYGEDALGNKSTLASVNPINIDITAPTITITNPNTDPAQSKTITASATESATKYYAIKNTGVGQDDCDGTHGIVFTAYDSITFTAEADNGKKVCYKAVDTAGNTAYSLSNAIGGIDRTAPVITITNPNTSPAQSKTITASMNEGGSLYKVINDAGNNTCDGTLTFTAYDSVTFTAEGDNGKKVCYKAVDTAGNTAYSLSNAIAGIDTSAPAKPIITGIADDTGSSATDGITSDTTLYINGTAEANSTVTVTRVGTGILGTTSANGSGDWSYNYTGTTLSNGATYSFTATATDAAGNTGAVSDAYSATIDTSAPATPVISHIAGDEKINAAEAGAIIITGTAEANSTVNVSLSDAGNAHTVTGSGPATGGNFSITINGTTLNDGTITPSVTATDTAGNVSSAATTPTALKDVVAPTAPIISHIAGDEKINNSEKNAIHVIGTAEANALISITLTNGVNSKTGTQQLSGGGTDFDITIDGTTATPSALADGTITPSATATDAAGNTSSAVTTPTATQDTGIPSAPGVALTDPINNANKGSVTLTLTGEVGTTYNYSIDDTDGATLAITGSGTLDASPKSITWIDLTGLSDGTITATVTLTDSAGNNSSSGTGTATKDVVAPATPVTTHIAGDEKINASEAGAIIVTGTAEANSTVNVSLSDTHAHTVSGSGTATGGNFSITIDGTTLSDDTITPSAIATDAAGNTSGAATTPIAVKDTGAPGVTSVVLSDPSPTKAGAVTFTVNFSENMDQTVNPTVSFGTTAPYNQHITATPHWNSATQFTSQITIGAWDGTNTIKISGAKDVAGNTMADDTTNTFVIDTIDPTATISSPTDGAYKGGNFTFSGTASDGSGSGLTKVELRIRRASDSKYWKQSTGNWNDAAEWNDATGTDSWNFSYTGGIADTNYTIDAKATDNAGNYTYHTNYSTITIHGDVNAPTSAVTTPADGSQVSSVTVAGTASDTAGTNHSGVQKVEVSIKRSNGDYWNGSSWVGGGEVYIDSVSYYSGAGTWAKTTGLPIWVSGETYVIHSKSTDNVNNIQSGNGSATFLFDNTAPTVVLSDDHADAIVRDADTVVITATFTEADQIDEGTVPKITINSPPLVNGASMTKSSNLVWTYSWNVPAGNDGTHTVSISAHDRAGNVNTDATGKTSYTIDNTNPTTSITDPTAGQYKKGTFTISADAADTGGSGVAKVEFYEGMNYLGEDTTAPYSYDWATTSANDGAHSLTTVATDVGGNQTTSSAVNITVDNSNPTSVSITDPTAGQTKRGTITVAASAADAIGLSKAEFYQGATKIGEDMTFPYSISWDTTSVSDGNYNLTAVAIDNAANSLTSAGVGITVDNTAPNAPAFNSSQDQNVWYRTNPTLDIDFSDNIKINTVEYKVDAGGTFRTIASDVNAPTYTADWSITAGGAGDWDTMTQGEHYLYFRITDYAGNQYATPDNGSGFRFKKDVAAPTAPTYNTTEDQWFASNPTLDIDFSDNQALKKIEYKVDGATVVWTTLADNLSGLAYSTDWSLDSGIWGGLGDGAHYIYFRVSDYAGNVYTTADNAAGFTFKKDTTAPSAISGMLIDHTADVWSAINGINFNWDDATDVGGSGLAGYSYVIDHTADTAPDGTVENATSAYTTTPALTDGSDWYFHVKAIDAVGNATAVAHFGPFKIDTTDPNISHSAVSHADAGADIGISADVTDGGSGVKEAHVFYKHHGDSDFTEKNMSCDGAWHCTYDIPDEENSDYDVKYYIRALDNVNNDAFDGTSGSPHTVDIVPASLDHFTFVFPTSKQLAAGTWQPIFLEARDTYENTVTGFNGSGDTVYFTTDELGVGVKVEATGNNESDAFDNGGWAGKVKFGTGDITPSLGNIKLIATDSDNPSKTGEMTFTTTGTATYGTTGTVQGAESNGAEGQNGEVAGEGVAPEVQQGTAPQENRRNPYLPYETAVAVLIFGGGIWWWLRRTGSGSGNGGTNLFTFAKLREAAAKMRMFFW